MPHAQVPHFAFPFERDAGGRVKVLEQDTTEHVMACEEVIIRCPLGFRLERPDFGWPWPEFRNAPLPLDELIDALRRFEPRGRATGREYGELADEATRIIQIDVEV